MKQTATVECLILSDDKESTKILIIGVNHFTKNVLKIEGSLYEVTDSRYSLKFILKISNELK